MEEQQLAENGSFLKIFIVLFGTSFFLECNNTLYQCRDVVTSQKIIYCLFIQLSQKTFVTL